jgi:micrococcal nuclease
MQRPTRLRLLGVGLGLALALALVGGPEAGSGGGTARVLRVIDGDTIEVELAGKAETVRLIGVDTPETRHPRKPVQAFGKEATAFTRQMVEGKEVRLEFDVQPRDKYGRLLGYVYVGDTMLNAELVRQGYAQVATYPPNVKYQERFLALQREAREAGRGLWGKVG